jgi:hypothetical protein
MKKILQNVYFDYCLKAALFGLLVWFISLQVEVRDFVKYKQPGVDEKQSTAIIMQTDRISECEASSDEQNSNTNKRVDDIRDDQNLIKYKVDMIYNILLKQDQSTTYNQN